MFCPRRRHFFVLLNLLSPLQQVTRLITIVWQSAVPPTLCTVSVLLTYIILQHFNSVRLFAVCLISDRPLSSPLRRASEQMQKQMWYPTLQAMVGKLYILSLFYNLCVIPLPHSVYHAPFSFSVAISESPFSATPVHCLIVNDPRHRHTLIPSRCLHWMGRVQPD